MRIRNIKRRVLLGLGTVLTAGLLSSACGEITDPSRAFLLRIPSEPGRSGATAFTFSENSTGTIDFEWEAAPGAERYEITMWRAADLDSVNYFNVNFDEPTFTIPISSPKVVLVQYDSVSMVKDGVVVTVPDGRELAVVQHQQMHSDMAALMQAAGLAAETVHYFVWSVYAEGGGDRWRSPENHRMSMRWEASP